MTPGVLVGQGWDAIFVSCSPIPNVHTFSPLPPTDPSLVLLCLGLATYN